MRAVASCARSAAPSGITPGSVSIGARFFPRSPLASIALCTATSRRCARRSRLEDGLMLLELKRAMHDGTRAVAFTPWQFLRRIASIVPPPRVHSTRYFGAFAPSSKVRPRIVASRPDPAASGCREPGEIDEGAAQTPRSLMRSSASCRARSRSPVRPCPSGPGDCSGHSCSPGFSPRMSCAATNAAAAASSRRSCRMRGRPARFKERLGIDATATPSALLRSAGAAEPRAPGVARRHRAALPGSALD